MFREERKAGDDRGGRPIERVGECIAKPISVSADDANAREFLLKQIAEGRLVFDEDEPFRRQTARQQRLRHGSGPRSEFDDGAFGLGIDALRHCAGKETPRWRYRASEQRIFKPGTNKPRFITEAQVDSIFWTGMEFRLTSLRAQFAKFPRTEASCENLLTNRKASRNGRSLPQVKSKNSFILAKKPVDSGWVLWVDSFSNSASSSLCLFVKFCGVSTLTWM